MKNNKFFIGILVLIIALFPVVSANAQTWWGGGSWWGTTTTTAAATTTTGGGGGWYGDIIVRARELAP